MERNRLIRDIPPTHTPAKGSLRLTASVVAAELGRLTPRDRHLLDLATSQPEAGRTLIALVNQQDLANSVGSVREVVARIHAELRAEGLVRTSPGRVEILDPIRMSQELWSRSA